ncbi:hypothetical protein MesoLj113c_28200 [Mesorhizobium sp. 113-3-9]|nr:hypothetical protein MesoLj113c_28200 [Mesorhizobium sp. 113-3-9]
MEHFAAGSCSFGGSWAPERAQQPKPVPEANKIIEVAWDDGRQLDGTNTGQRGRDGVTGWSGCLPYPSRLRTIVGWPTQDRCHCHPAFAIALQG